MFNDPYAQFFLDVVTARGGSSIIHSNLFPWLQQNHPTVSGYPVYTGWVLF